MQIPKYIEMYRKDLKLKNYDSSGKKFLKFPITINLK